ncbi:hypothetical protein EJ03DRAFT_341732 [Teratosphaeria nubilosa]|uniref:Xylanolytic transcriptional activator regulatory domain-containing protein n=1 Tax=Teratosphaeria nubilosa TaxID=161662 RepID=A0A6G1LHM1_9PEZI|nr:hypothetical protein EJ03DRAFT_341732 [Teratosphaeria nubilosa]
MAEDIQVLEHYLTSEERCNAPVTTPYNLISNTAGKSIVYLNVPKRRKGLRTETTKPGETQREILEHVLGPHKSEVIELYFQHVNPCFPVIDEKTFKDMWHRDGRSVSSTLMCDIYASALAYWQSASALRHNARPDMAFVWNQAVAALQEDFTAPAISTVHSALLDLVGRPIGQTTGNIVNTGRTITLAHSLGLHRDPTSWKVTVHEKHIRVRLWWGVLIHDHWSALAHGIPPSIHQPNYDVPLPELDALSGLLAGEEKRQASASFVHLCSLTQILGQILPAVYALHAEQQDIWRGIRRWECAMDDWEDKLPMNLRQATASESKNSNGSSSLWFCFMSVKLLICRLAFKMCASSPAGTNLEAKQYRLAMLRDAACALTDFTLNLSDAQLREFWLPYTAYLLVSSTTILLRTTLESTDLKTKQSCAQKLVKLQTHLRQAQCAGWDLADFCIERCQRPIERIAVAIGVDVNETVGNDSRNQDPIQFDGLLSDLDGFHASGRSFTDADLLLPVDALDFPWQALWDNIEGGTDESTIL